MGQRQGHFLFESGHHGGIWLDLELLFWRPEKVQSLAAALADRIGALAVYGDSANRLATANKVALEALASYPNRIWKPADCPLCAGGIPLETHETLDGPCDEGRQSS
jgi:hypothetical protein